MEKKTETTRHRRDKLLDGVIKNFFSPGEIKKFNRDFLSNSRTTGKTSLSKSSLQKNKEIAKQAEIDLLITFAEGKLEKPKYLEFLLQLGQYTVTAGINDHAYYILENIITETKGKADFEKIYADAALATGEMYSSQALWKQCIKYIRISNRIYKKINDLKGLVRSQNLVGAVYLEKGEIIKSRYYFKKGLEAAHTLKDYELMGISEVNIAITFAYQNIYTSSLDYFKKALINFEKIENLKQVANSYNNLGLLYSKINKPQEAIVEYDRCAALARKINFSQMLAVAYNNKAFLLIKLKDFNLAESLAEEALEISNRINSKINIADIYCLKGIIQRNYKNYALAEDYFYTSVRICREIRDDTHEIQAEYELAKLYMEKGQLSESRKHFLIALKYYKKIKARKQIKEIEKLLPSLRKRTSKQKFNC